MENEMCLVKNPLECPYLSTYYPDAQCHFRKGVKYHFNNDIGFLIKDLKTCPRNKKREVRTKC
jgi:hypothetical protein